LRNTIWIIHKKIVIDCNSPWFSSNIIIYSINWSIIFCLCLKSVLDQKWEFGTRSNWSDPIAISKHVLNILSKINWSIRWKRLNWWVRRWPSLPPLTGRVPIRYIRCCSKSWPKYCHRCIEGIICPLRSIANNLGNIWWTSLQSINWCSAKWRNLLHHRSMSKTKFYLSI
jgi:hypothetical protein